MHPWVDILTDHGDNEVLEDIEEEFTLSVDTDNTEGKIFHIIIIQVLQFCKTKQKVAVVVGFAAAFHLGAAQDAIAAEANVGVIVVALEMITWMRRSQIMAMENFQLKIIPRYCNQYQYNPKLRSF